MKLSVIIVSYNVKDLLKQCLESVLLSLSEAGFAGEVIVVDNNSTETGITALASSFPSVQFVFNTENKGFAKACNQGAGFAKGEFLLFLNPDTIVPADCFRKVVGYMEEGSGIGAMGVRMLDEQGIFLKESKRGFPSPRVSFFKLSGLTALFPKSKIFARYYLGHLDENRDHEVEVLSGAFMLLGKKIFEKVGGFDERFFMYAEDIDLSHRISKAGYKLVYFAGTTITHYKGKSTAKDLKYVRLFYKAMIQFAEKEYGKRNPYTLLLKLGIWLRGSFSAAGVFLKRISGS